MKNGTKKLIILTASLLITGHILLFYALPLKVFVAIFIVFAIFFQNIGGSNALLVSVSLALSTLLFSLFLKISEINKSIYYRPHEMFSYFDNNLKRGRYEKNIHFEMKMPHGDLKALAVYEDVAPETRNVIFRTDSIGFRNSTDYHGQKYLLVGDSFVAGSGTTQDEIITQQLLIKYNIDSYNLAYPGEIIDYINNIEIFEDVFKEGYKVILFLFEGNDFPLYEPIDSDASSEASTLRNIYVDKLRHYYKQFNKTDIYRFMYSHISRYSLKKEDMEELVDIRIVDGMSVSFYKNYISITERDFLLDNPDIEKTIKSIKNKIAHIYFIPTKYRVYFKHIAGSNSGEVSPLPHKQWELVQRIGEKYNIQVSDLTAPLIKESDHLLRERKFTYWRDDTHWNGHGISIAAKIIARQWNQQQ